MTELLSFPFRLDTTNRVVTKDSGSEEYTAERLTVLLGTRPGERPMVPTFGLRDPAFEGFVEQALRLQVQRFGIPADIGLVQRLHYSDAQERVIIQFSMVRRTLVGGDI